MSVSEGKLKLSTPQGEESLEAALSIINQGVMDSTPRLLTNEDISDDSSRIDVSESPFSDADTEIKIEDILNSSDTNALLDTLKLKITPDSKHLDLTNEELVKVTETPLLNTNILDEFPLFHHSLPNHDIIEEEIRLSTPEKLNDKENYPIYNKARLSTEPEGLSPISKKMQSFQNSKSRIPLPSIQPAVIRRSKRLIEHSTEDRDICIPKKFTGVLKPAIRQEKPVLSLMVDSSSGKLYEATKYATEINACNCEGIPIPTNPNELVSIPVNGSRKAAKKTALVRAHRIEAVEKRDSTVQVGFYTQAQFKKYFSTSSPNKIQKMSTETAMKKRKKLRWANELEW